MSSSFFLSINHSSTVRSGSCTKYNKGISHTPNLLNGVSGGSLYLFDAVKKLNNFKSGPINHLHSFVLKGKVTETSPNFITFEKKLTQTLSSGKGLTTKLKYILDSEVLYVKPRKGLLNSFKHVKYSPTNIYDIHKFSKIKLFPLFFDYNISSNLVISKGHR